MDQDSKFDPDETIPLEDDPDDNTQSRHLLTLLDNPIDETTAASLLSHLIALRNEGRWNHKPSHELVLKSFRSAIGGTMDPILSKRILTDGILPMASISSLDDSCCEVSRIVYGVVMELLYASSREGDTKNTGDVNEGIKILLPTFLHRLDNEESCHSGDAATDDKTTVDEILDRFCGRSTKYKSHPQVTAGLLSALKEFDNLSSSRLSKRRTWQKRSNYTIIQDYTYEFVDRPTSLIRMAILSLEELASSKDPEALPPLVYQLGILPMGLLHGDNKLKVKGENEKQRGMRLRRMVLEGIASALEDGSLGLSTGHGASSSSVMVQSSNNSKNDVWRWSRYTSLSHMGSCLRMDPEMSKAVLAMLSGEISTPSSGNVPPFRYQRLTPFKLAMGLSMASSVSRMRQKALECVRDLIVEEETIRIQCGLGRDGKRVGLGKPWMLCLVRCLEKVSNGDEKAWDEFQLENEGRLGHVLKCLVTVAKFAESSEGGEISCAPLILQSLISLGFLLVDCVKKDELTNSGAIQASALLGNTLDMSILNDASIEDTSANHATACVGRVLLCYLFYQSAAASSHFMTSTLSRSSNEGGGTSLCRTILKSTIDKLCGMAPNALEHGKVLTDLLQFSPASLKSITQALEAGCDGLDDRQKEEVISLAMATHYIPMLIDTLSNVPGGGMHPRVATQAVIPAVRNLLFLQASAGSLRPGLAGYLWKKQDIIDHVDHGYLLAKKSLFCIDEEKRKCAASMLISLIGVAVIASSGGNKRTISKWTPALDEMRSSLRRCLTQHQPSVRLETYSSLMALLPIDSASSDASQTQESVSPKSNATQSPNQRPNHSTPLVPPSARESLTDIVCCILSSQLERYLTTPPEQIQDKRARQHRGSAIGSQLSQVVEPAVENTQENENSMPLRFEAFITTRSKQADKPKGKSKKSTQFTQTLLNDALDRITEPLGFLIASCGCASQDIAPRDIDIAEDTKHQEELHNSISSLRHRMAGCHDIEHYLKWLKSNKHIFEIQDNMQRKVEMATCKLATLITVAVAAEALLGTCNSGGENDDEFVEVDSTNEEVESLFNLRVDAITRAAEIMSSFVNSKPKKTKKLKERDSNAESESPKKKRKTKEPKEDDDAKETANGMTTTTEINRVVVEKNKKLIEEAICNISPALSPGFLAEALRKFGAEVESKFLDSPSADSDDEEDESAAITRRLSCCMEFRRFIITKAILLLGGNSKVVKTGLPFASLNENTNGLIASSLSLGPLLFAEFCSHCYQLERTSLSNASNQVLPLSQLSLRGFTICVRGMASNAFHKMSKAVRVNALWQNSIRKASSAAPSSKDGWDHYNKLNVDHQNTSAEELAVKKALTAIVSRSSSSNRICLFEELLSQSMNGEAIECANLVLVAASVFADPNLREHFGVTMLKCYEACDDGESVGVLGLDFGEDNDRTCLAHVVNIGVKLGDSLDSETHAPFPASFLGRAATGNVEEKIRSARSKAGLSMTTIENWPTKHQEWLKEEILSTSACGMGIVQKMAWALTVHLSFGKAFEASGPNGLSTKTAKLRCIKTISKTPESNFNQEIESICQSISACIEHGLDNADFITLKVLPNLSEKALDLAQQFVACNILTTSKVICASAPSAEFVDINGSFASLLLKNAKRLYSNLVRFVLSYASNAKSICNETKVLLDYMTSTLKPRISSLLLTLQQKQETSGGKYLAESKIESHGRTASQLVFEKEKLDNALLKVGSSLKQAGLKEASDWLAKHVVNSEDRRFSFKDIEQAKKREAPRKKESAGSKRKTKKEPSGKKKKVKVKKEEDGSSDVDDVSQANTEDCSDAESEGAHCEVVSESNMTEDMGDEESDEAEGQSENDCDEEDVSEEEEEFDD